MFAFFLPTRIPFSNIFGIGILFITICRIIELTFDVKFGITAIMSPLIPLPQVTNVLMPGVITLGFILIGLVLVSWSRYKRFPLQSTLLFFASQIIFLLGVTGAISYFVPLHLSFLWRATPVNLYAQIIAICIGIGFMAATCYFDMKLNIGLINRLPIIVSLAISLFAIFISWGIALEKAKLALEITNSKLNDIKLRMISKLKEDFLLLEQLSLFIEHDKTHSFVAKEPEMFSYLHSQEELRAIEWTDPKLNIRSSIPQEKIQIDLNNIPSDMRQQLHNYIKQKKMFLMLLPKENSENYDFLLMKPLQWDGAFQGLAIFVIDTKAFLDTTIHPKSITDFALIISVEEKNLLKINDHFNFNILKKGGVRDNFDLENLTFSISMYPTLHLINTITNKTLIYMILFGGFVISMGAGVLMQFWQIANIKVVEAEIFKKKLLEAEKDQLDTLKSAHIGTWNWDLKTNKFYADEFTQSLLGFKPEEFKGSFKNILEKIVPVDREHIQFILKQCLETGKPINCTYRVNWPNESIHWIVTKGKLFFDNKKIPEKITGISWEITSTKKAELLLEISEEIYRILSENEPIQETFDRIIQSLNHYQGWGVMILWFLEPKTDMLQLYSIAHIPTLKIPGFEEATRNHEKIIVPNHIWSSDQSEWFEDLQKNSKFSRTQEATDAGLKGSFTFPLIEGSHVIGLLELFKQKPFLDEVDEGFLTLMASIGIGIGQYLKRQLALDALSTSEKKFRDFVETTEEWFWEIDDRLIFTYTNPIIIKILGYSPEQVIGTEMLTLLPKNKHTEIEKQIKKCIQIKEGWGKRITEWVHRDGSIRWLESNAHPILDKKNNVIGFRGADRDITERKLIEKTKNEFISMVNHELRTPLSSILGALGLIRDNKNLSKRVMDLCDIAYRNSERLSFIINDILDIEKFELGKFEFDLKPQFIQEIIDESINSSKLMAGKFDIKIIKEGIFTDVQVLVDRRRLIQVLMNLFSNAFKFSPTSSTVFISMQILDQMVRISIRDQGIGISDEFKTKVFQKFAQADASDARSATGTGLGLNISKNLIEGMHGNINFATKMGGRNHILL